jgi:hypothetical protein
MAARTRKSATETRQVLVILSNRFRPSEEPRFLEIRCQSDGTILSEKRLSRPPGKAVYDEVWENNDARQSLDSCKSVKRHYKHPLIKPPAPAPAPAAKSAAKSATKPTAKSAARRTQG